jgi:hypothetical protein
LHSSIVSHHFEFSIRSIVLAILASWRFNHVRKKTARITPATPGAAGRAAQLREKSLKFPIQTTHRIALADDTLTARKPIEQMFHEMRTMRQCLIWKHPASIPGFSQMRSIQDEHTQEQNLIRTAFQ